MQSPQAQVASQAHPEDLSSIVREQKRLIDHLLNNHEDNRANQDHDIRDAIVQCAREEVRNALQSISCLNKETLVYPRRSGGVKNRRADVNAATGAQKEAKRRRSLRNGALAAGQHKSCRPKTSACGERRPRSGGRKEIESTARSIYSESQRPQTVSSAPIVEKRPGSKSRLLSPTPLSLESIRGASSDKHGAGEDGIDLSSFQWLEKSADVVLSTTGRAADDLCHGVSPLHCGSGGNDQPKVDILAQRPKTALGLPSARGASRHKENTPSSSHLLRRQQSFPTIPLPHSSIKPRHRPTTALERRKPRPNSAVIVRSKAEQLAKRMLGPIDLDAKPNTAPLPSTLDANEWENQIVRNIVALYSNKVVTELKEDQGTLALATTNDGGDGAQTQDGANLDATGQADESKITPRKPLITCSNKTQGKTTRFKTRLPKLAPPVNPKMIWYCGTGRLRVDWSSLNDSDICATLEKMEENGKYLSYVERVETLLQAIQVETSGSSPLKQLWRQLVLACNGFAVKVIENRRKQEALELLQKAQRLIGQDGIIPEEEARQLTAFVKDSYAYYYARRNKPSAALQYVLSAVRTHKRLGDSMNVARCSLHKAYILTQLDRYTESMQCMSQVLGMLKDGSLDLGGGRGKSEGLISVQQKSSDPQAVLVVAVAYHNVAVQQIILGYLGDACLSSQNARRLARLCLSVGSRYIPSFEATHRRALGDLAAVLRRHQTDREAKVFEKLIEQLFV